jgi:hypothetical protein
VLYVPQANKNLVSVHKLAYDNNAFFESHHWYFFIKDRVTRRILVRGKCEDGIYPLKSISNKRVFAVTKPSTSQWHNRFDHPSSSVVRQILSKNKVPFVLEENNESICDACQQGKSH